MKETCAAAVLVVSLAFLAVWISADHAEAGAGRQSSDTFAVGERIPTFPTGFDVLSCQGSGSWGLEIQGGVATVTLGATGRIECSDYTYSCDVSRCVIEDQLVTEGVVRRESAGGGTNRPPRPTGSIPAQTLSLGGSAVSVNVALYFTDPDGDALTYSASSNRTGIVRASASGSTVTLTPVAAGTAMVTVTARDSGGLSATQSIAVTVEGDGGATALWSSTLTAQSFELALETTFRLVGYLRLDDSQQVGELGDPDFDLRGTTHYVRGLFQNRDDWSVWLIINPPPDPQDLRSMTLTVDGGALAVGDATEVDDGHSLGALVTWGDPGFRWSDAQRIAVQLATGQDGGVANRAPRASGSIPAQTLSVGGRAASVNVAGYFTDPDGDALTYTASSNRTGVVRASASGGTVTLGPVAAGAATVTVTARDPGGLSATQSIAVTVQAAGGVNGFTDDPLVAGVTPVRAVHFRELRTRIDALRSQAGLSAYAWTDPTLRADVTAVSSVHLTELRTALRQVYDASGQPRPAYTDASVRPGTTPIRAAHVTELRTAVVELENAAPTGMMPDLVVGPPTVDDSTLTPAQSFTLSTTVRNRGSARSAATTLRYYRSTDSTISTSDTAVGTDAVAALAGGASSAESIALTAPDSAGTYYYGACVASVSEESDTGNNCSAGVGVTVESSGGDPFELAITTCSASPLGSLWDVVIAGTVRALVDASSVIVTGYVDDTFVGVDVLGDISAGETKNFRVTGIISSIGNRCRITVEGRRSSGGAEVETSSVSEIGPVR